MVRIMSFGGPLFENVHKGLCRMGEDVVIKGTLYGGSIAVTIYGFCLEGGVNVSVEAKTRAQVWDVAV